MAIKLQLFTDGISQPQPILKVALVQALAVQHDVTATLAHLEEQLATIPTGTDLVLLPEMFNTGYTTDPKWAESAEYHTYRWLKGMAKRLNALVAGSIMWRNKEGQVTNRLLGMHPNGTCWHYDKRHLFSFAGEHEHLAPGCELVTWQYKGWNIRPFVCYDLRFPVWLRQLAGNPAALYIGVANWPASRLPAWNALLAARAIENQAYVIGINRAEDLPLIDTTTNALVYAGGSAAHDPSGRLLHLCTAKPEVKVLELPFADWQAFRERFPFHADADAFSFGS